MKAGFASQNQNGRRRIRHKYRSQESSHIRRPMLQASLPYRKSILGYETFGILELLLIEYERESRGAFMIDLHGIQV